MKLTTELGFLPPRSVRVKNKTPSEVQITAEQLIREAREGVDGAQNSWNNKKKDKITNADEFSDYCIGRRKEFEDLIRCGKQQIGIWIRYARWEEECQKDVGRARSVWERALEQVGFRNPSLWLKYAQVEMKHKFINHARNIFDRAVSLLPRVDQLWFNYIHMEEMLGNVSSARHIFDRWMRWMPDHQGWMSYVKFELRCGETERARQIFERYVKCLPTAWSWIRYAKFELKNGDISRSRRCYERALENLTLDAEDDEAQHLFVAFAEFEEQCNEVERARCIYRFALRSVPTGGADFLFGKFIAFEKRHTDKQGIEDAVVEGKARLRYEEQVRQSPLDYDAWFGYIRLEEGLGNRNKIRQVYERAIANVPPAEEKHYWQRYIYLWIYYALYEELGSQDVDRTREVYTQCLRLIPHHKFSFAKIWLLAAQFDIRQKNLQGARKLLGNSIGRAPKSKIFKQYIQMELQMGGIDRCRTLYHKYLEWAPHNCDVWIKYAEMEQSLCEIERARAIFELATAQPALNLPEHVWKKYIDFEMSQGEHQRVRQLYERLLDRTNHLKVWISYAAFEATAGLKGTGTLEQESDKGSLLEQRKQCLQRAQRVYRTALSYYRTSAPELKEERSMLLEEWLSTETSFGDVGNALLVQNELPKKLKRRKVTPSEDGAAGYEEYCDYVFPEESAALNMQILEAAYKWKKQRTTDRVLSSNSSPLECKAALR